ncbi:MAG: hypothetical protein ACQKBU_07780, partial [Verrucomicrobiales bacterium]
SINEALFLSEKEEQIMIDAVEFCGDARGFSVDAKASAGNLRFGRSGALAACGIWRKRSCSGGSLRGMSGRTIVMLADG